MYWFMESARKCNAVENGEVIRAFIQGVVITLAAEMSRDRKKLAREVIHVRNIEPPEPNALCHIMEELPSKAHADGEKRRYPSSARKADNLEEAPSVVNCGAPDAVFASSLPAPRAVPPFSSPGGPLVNLLLVREVVDIERYDLDSSIDITSEGYVKQFVIGASGDALNNIILPKDLTYNGDRPKQKTRRWEGFRRQPRLRAMVLPK
ncbi:hypothetical protein HOY80DRAFT_1097187 [Tuber brumale]|nr:hypothetical protein HOY80DRAFT_1097187 [Tuber brumale]